MSLGRIMIVEDEVIVAEDLRRGLTAAGYDVVAHAVDGREAIALASSVAPDVILMDVFLDGDLDGIAAARAITASIDVAIIYVSANAADALVDDAVRSGADAYLFKPFQLPQVLTALKVVLHRRKARQARGEPTPLLPSAGSMTAATPAKPSNGMSGALASGGRDHFAAMLQKLQATLNDTVWVGRDEDVEDAKATVITAREKDVIRGLLCYRRLSIVAEVLGISIHTARNHLKSVFRKLDLHSQDDLLRFLIDGQALLSVIAAVSLACA